MVPHVRSTGNLSSQLLYFFSPSHLSASTLRRLPARIMTCQCFLSFAISVVISQFHCNYITYYTSSHLLTFLPLHFVVGRLESPHANVFCLQPSQSSSGFLLYPLSPGLAISALVCLDFAFHLLPSVISFSWPFFINYYTIIAIMYMYIQCSFFHRLLVASSY